MQNQNTIEETHSCLVKNILQAAEKIIPKTSPETKKRLLVAWWKKEYEREDKIVIAEYRKHCRNLTNTIKLRSF